MSAVGYAAATTHIYSLGLFFEPLEQEFGWGRSDVAFGLTIASAVIVIFGTFLGMSVDRIGPRRIAIFGLCIYCATFAALATTGASVALSGVLAVTSLPLVLLFFSALPPQLIAGTNVLLWGEADIMKAAIAAALFGLAGGGEVDVLAYMTSRYFGLKSFGTLFALVSVFGTIGLGLEPLLGGLVHDLTGTYDPLLLAVMHGAIFAAFLAARLGPYPVEAATEQPGAVPAHSRQD
ncbi:MAG: hypothetical protein P8J20_15055 [Novosphingobium sp.]|nr:hypothetical protein [Novosphingobium sp.]